MRQLSRGIKVDGPITFDIASDGESGNQAWLLAGGTLPSVDIGLERPSPSVPAKKGQVWDMAILPQPGDPGVPEPTCAGY